MSGIEAGTGACGVPALSAVLAVLRRAIGISVATRAIRVMPTQCPAPAANAIVARMRTLSRAICAASVTSMP